MVSSRAFALYFSASLFSCFDHFIGVFDYSLVGSMLSCYHGVQGKDPFYLPLDVDSINQKLYFTSNFKKIA